VSPRTVVAGLRDRLSLLVKGEPAAPSLLGPGRRLYAPCGWQPKNGGVCLMPGLHEVLDGWVVLCDYHMGMFAREYAVRPATKRQLIRHRVTLTGRLRRKRANVEALAGGVSAYRNDSSSDLTGSG
jgi:hypothetical protein